MSRKNAPIATVESAAGKTVAVTTGSALIPLLQKIAPQVSIKEFPNIASSTNALIAGQVDGLFTGNATGRSRRRAAPRADRVADRRERRQRAAGRQGPATAARRDQQGARLDDDRRHLHAAVREVESADGPRFRTGCSADYPGMPRPAGPLEPRSAAMLDGLHRIVATFFDPGPDPEGPAGGARRRPAQHAAALGVRQRDRHRRSACWWRRACCPDAQRRAPALPRLRRHPARAAAHPHRLSDRPGPAARRPEHLRRQHLRLRGAGDRPDRERLFRRDLPRRLPERRARPGRGGAQHRHDAAADDALHHRPAGRAARAAAADRPVHPGDQGDVAGLPARPDGVAAGDVRDRAGRRRSTTPTCRR